MTTRTLCVAGALALATLAPAAPAAAQTTPQERDFLTQPGSRF